MKEKNIVSEFDERSEKLARIAYAAYIETYPGMSGPTFDDLPNEIKRAWIRAVDAVSEEVLRYEKNENNDD